MKILITNDDGVYASGINILYETLKDHHQVTVVAPTEEKSTTGHSLGGINHPIRVHQMKENFYAVSGHPADCVLMGLGHFCQGRDRPDLVLSGINRGGNLGQDIYYSGTVAGAREGVFHGVKGMAVSLAIELGQAKEHYNDEYKKTANLVKELLAKNILNHLNEMELYNLNTPPLMSYKGIKWATLGHRFYSEDIMERVDSRNRPYFWTGSSYIDHNKKEASDCSYIEEGFATLSKIILGKNVDNPESFNLDIDLK